MKIQVTQTLPNGQVTQQVLSKDGAEVLKIQAQPGAKLSFNVEGAKPADAANAKAKTGNIKKSGNNLVLESEGEALVEVTDFYSTAGASVGNVGWNYAAADAGVSTATPEAQALSSDAAVSESGALFPAIAPGWLVAGGAATVAAVASGGSSSAATVASNIVSGAIVAGPVVAGHGLSVVLYKADGTTLLGTATVDASGKFSLDVGSYTGVIIAKVIDAGVGSDYADEASGLDVDLGAQLMAVGVMTGGALKLNINPLTSIAAQKAGLLADGSGSVATATDATEANAAVAKAFGLTDITQTDPDTTNDSVAGTNAIGAVLAALSGLDAQNGNAQTTIDNFVAGITQTGAVGVLTAPAQTAALQGAAIADPAGTLGLVNKLSDSMSAAVTTTGFTIGDVATDNIIKPADGILTGTTITGTVATGTSVSDLDLKIGGVASANNAGFTLVGTTWTYTLSAADEAALTTGADGALAIELTVAGVTKGQRMVLKDMADDAPSAVTFLNAVTSILENADNSNGTKLADINIADIDGYAGVAPVAFDTTNFEVRTTLSGKYELWLLGGASINYETVGGHAWTTTVTAGTTSSQTFNLAVANVNEAPTGTNATITIAEDVAGGRVLTAADFGFGDTADSSANVLSAVIITTLPTVGTLKLNGVVVTAGQSIAVADLSGLVYAPALDGNGTGYATIGFKVQDNGLTANGGVDTSVTANTLTIDVTAVNDAPTLATPTALALTDTVAKDTFTNQTGTLVGSDVDASTTLTYGIDTGTAGGATLINTVTYDVSKVGTYGTLYVKATGEYVYVVNATAVNAVSADTTEAFTVTASDGVATGNNTLTINVTGANDRPVLASNFGVHTPPLAGDDDYIPLIIGQPVPLIVNASDDFTDADTGHAAMTFSLLSVDGVLGATIAGVTFHSDGTVTGTPTDVVGVTYPLDYTVIVRAFDGNNSALYADHTYIVHMLKAPVAQSISVVDGASSNTTALGKAGETLDVSVVFSEVVDVVGLPTITLSINGQTTTATYSAGSGAPDKTLHFTVAIPSGSTYDGHSISLTGVSANILATSVTGRDSGQSWDATPMPAAYTGYTVDNTASAAPTLTSVTDDVTAITGVVSAGGTTNDTTPTVRVSLTTTGANAVVAGDTVQLYNNTTALGTAVTLSSTDVSNGYVDITPTSLTNGTTYTLNAKVTDAAGNTSVASGNYAVTIDTAAPVISGVAFGTTTGALKVGDTLTATITADQATYTAGAITINGKATTGFTNNGNNTYTVTYTVAQGDVDVLDTAAIPVSVVLVDTAGNSNMAYETAPAFSSAPAVDAHVPTITSVAISATGALNSTLNTGDVVTATVTFNESVTATAGSTLGILVGSNTRLATVTAATGTSLTYTYTVAAGDVDADGISVPAAGFTLNAGTIKDAAGNNAVLTYTAVAAQAGYKVDTAAPTITATETVAENATTVALHYTDASASLSWALAGADVDNDKFTINSTTGVLTFNAAPNFEAPIDLGANNVYDVTVTATDLAGNVATAVPVTISVTNVNEAPTLSGSIAAQHAISGVAYSYDVHSFFTDPDAGSLPATYSTLTYSATGLASGLSIDVDTGVISGTHTGAVAAAPVVVTATDGVGSAISQTAFNMDVVVAPALTATQALDGVGTGLTTALSVQSALVISFDSVVTLGSGHIHIYDDMGTTGWAHTNTTTLESVADSSKNDIDITIDATTHQATAVFIGGQDYSSRFNLATSVVLDSTSHNLVIDLKQATASAAGTGVWSTAFDWDFGANYHVNFDAGIVKNLAGIGNAALNDGSTTATGALQNTTINFTTVAPTNAGALSQVMDSTGATTGLVDSLYWINGNQGNNAGATPTTIDLSGKNTAVVLDSNGAATASGGLQGNILLKNFGFDTNAWNRNDFIYMDNHGNQALLTTDGLVAAASLASASTNLSVSNGSTVNSLRSLTDTGSVGGSSYLYIDGTGLPTGTTWGSGLSSESTFELASKGAYNAIIFG